ncbi:hypothetical protein AVEN_169842-1 [Araneus ventricosus]|uniref:Uncharacterized protein n=1 Tax=Araneus ventricosus TaxID=182803 RepID=A0A4Y2UV18_ARAVE|nr:hypothetical protein AVEN_231674-1 [Araneus ventricosus]GBO15390.1 hypothetical protein AVEN_169842-1 [Araneus ventricosus]
MFSIEDCIIQLATPVSTRGSRSSDLSTTNCEEKKGEGGRVHFTNRYVNKTSVYKGSKILRAARSQRVNTTSLLCPPGKREPAKLSGGFLSTNLLCPLCNCT